VSGSDTAPIAVTQVGAAPVGISFFDHGEMLAVANSNRFSQPTKSQTVSIINVQKALAGKPHPVVGNVVAGAFPREIAVSAHGTALYITNYNSGTVETIPTAALKR
jgi:DNA-binding beta-propeller fold protein YncE